MNADLLSRHPLPNNADNPAGVDEVDMVEIFGLHVVDLASEFFAEVAEGYAKCKDLNMIRKILSNPNNAENHTLISSLGTEYKKLFNAGRFILEDDLLYYRQEGSHRLIINPCMKEQILKICHDDILAGHFSLEKSILRLKNTAWWMGYKTDMEEYISTCDSCQKGNKQTGKRFGLLQEIQKPRKPWEMINMDFVT